MKTTQDAGKTPHNSKNATKSVQRTTAVRVYLKMEGALFVIGDLFITVRKTRVERRTWTEPSINTGKRRADG
jgi:hypothetical protein